MKTLLLVLALTVALTSAALFSTGNVDLKRAVSQAISDVVADNVNGFDALWARWYGSTGVQPRRPPTCGADGWPTPVAGGLLESIIANRTVHLVAYFPLGHERFLNSSGVYDGFEVQLAQLVFNRIALHYSCVSITIVWHDRLWYNTATDNALAAVINGDVDALWAGMSTLGKWHDIRPGQNVNDMINRTVLVQFSCAYEAGGDGAVAGPRALPTGADPLVNISSIDQTDIIVCTSEGSSMAQWAQSALTKATLQLYTVATLPRNLTLSGVCHVYLSMVMPALYDAQENPTLTYLGSYSDYPVAMAVRFDATATTATSSSTTPAPSAASTMDVTSAMALLAMLLLFLFM